MPQTNAEPEDHFEDSPCYAHRRACSRVLRIPELLSMIIPLCLPEDGERAERSTGWSLNAMSHLAIPGHSDKEGPLALAHVCQLWRYIALKTPRLWTRIHIHFTQEVSDSIQLLKRRLDALSFWLAHSRSLPISVCLSRDVSAYFGLRPILTEKSANSVPGLPSTPVDILFDILDTLYRHRHRWEHIYIDIFYFAIGKLYGAALSGDLPHLQSLELIQRQDYGQFDNGWECCLSYIRSAPLLRDLALSGLSGQYSVTLPSGVPRSLRALELNCMTVHLFPHENGMQITELVLDCVCMSDTDFSLFPDVFPLLENLTVSYSAKTNAVHDLGVGPVYSLMRNLIRLNVRSLANAFPLSTLVAPSLKELTVVNEAKYVVMNVDYFGDTISRFLRRSNAFIEYFMYSNTMPMNFGESVEDLLQEMPELREIDIRNPMMTSSILCALEDTSLCPRLTSIHIEGKLSPVDEQVRTQSFLEEPNIQDVLQLIRMRCCGDDRLPLSRFTSEEEDEKNRVWIKKLAMPLHRKDEEELRNDVRFKEAAVEYINTHNCYCDYPGE